MIKYNNIKTIHIELTDKCNASCPMCSRNMMGGVDNPFLPNSELSLQDFMVIFPKEKLTNISYMFFCGNFGDPIVAKDLLPIVKYLRKISPETGIGIHTNGSARSEEWWGELGTILINDKDKVVFGIDGLEDTNHIYRKGTDFNKIIANAKTFINAGGNAHWDYIVFQHNEHEVEAAESYSKQLGFKEFRIKKTGRFFSNSKAQVKEEQEVKNKNGEVIYKLRMPSSAQFRNNSLQKEQDIIKEHGSIMNYIQNTIVSCKAIEEQSVYISSEGLVFPCCWTANQLYAKWWDDPSKSDVSIMLENNGGKKSINALYNDIKNILASDFYKALENSWQDKSRPFVCGKICGKDFKSFDEQYK